MNLSESLAGFKLAHPKLLANAKPLTSKRIKHLASEALNRPSKLSAEEIRELGASVMRHIEPRAGKVD